MKLIRGAGRYIYTAGRKQMLDFTSGGIFQSIIGNDPELAFKAMGKLDIVSCYAPHHTNPWTERYIDMLKEWTGYESAALFTTGSEATEAFWRCMRVYTGKKGIWGGLVDPDLIGTDGPPSDAMHGVTYGALVMSGDTTEYSLSVHKGLGDTRFGMTPEATCGAIMESYHAPSAQFHRMDPTINRIVANQKEFPDIPLCVDEIQGGFGRTGKKWAHEWYEDLKPDFITIGKGAGAGMPLSALLGPAEIMESKQVKEHGHLHSTHSGHPMMCAVGCSVIEEIEKRSLIIQSRILGAKLDAGLRDCGVRYHAGRGLLAGLEFKDAKEADKMARVCQRRGLLVVPTGRQWVKIGPALTITEYELETGIAIIRDAVGEVIDG